METDVSLLHEYSLCFYNLFRFLVASYTASTFVFVVFFEPTLLTNQQDDVKNCVFWSRDQDLAEQQKGPNFERKMGKFKRS